MDSLSQAFFSILILLVLYALYQNKSAGFQNNDYYFNGHENDTMYIGQLIQPRLIHKINIPPEW